MTEEAQTKGEVTRLAIEDAAIELFLEHGYHATSMREIADHAGLALGGIYNHFKSKDEIFLLNNKANQMNYFFTAALAIGF